MAKRIRARVPGEELLDEKELAALHNQAKEEVVKDRKAKARKLLLEELKKDVLSETDPNEVIVTYQILLPSFAGHVMIDGVKYSHGEVHEFPAKQFYSVQEIVQNAWKHEEAAFGKRDPNAYFNRRNPVISATKSPAINIDNHFMRV